MGNAALSSKPPMTHNFTDKQPLLSTFVKTKSTNSKPRFVLVIHAGAGTMSRNDSTETKRKAYHAGLRVALEAGYKVLEEGGEAMDAAVAAVSTLEGSYYGLRASHFRMCSHFVR